jgi:uncharacterized membrane protein YqjE
VTETKPVDSDEPSIGDLVKQATTQLSAVVHGEIELAKIELTSTVKNLKVGAIGFVAAAAIAIFSLVFFFIALAELLAWLWFWRWAAYGVVFVFMLLIAGCFAWFLGVKKVKKIRAPQRTIETTKATVAALRHPHQSV